MFRKRRRKKEFPAGTFIAAPARIMAIIQLSLALMVLLWQLSQPFMGDLFAIRSKMAVYEYVLEKPDAFHELPANQQLAIKDGYASWQEKLQDSFWIKLKRSIEGVLLNMPLFERIWLLISLVLPILILLKVEGAVSAAWLIPIVVFAYAVDNQWNGRPPQLSAELSLFPSEEHLLQGYATGPVDPNPFHQKKALEAAWNAYLVKEWAHEDPAVDKDLLAEQVRKGEYLFTTARALAIEGESPAATPVREPSVLLIAYLLWNVAFAYTVTKFR